MYDDNDVIMAFNNLIINSASVISATTLTAKNDHGNHIVRLPPENGEVSIGYGRSVGAGGDGISEEEALYLLKNDLKPVYHSLVDTVRSFTDLDEPRQIVLMLIRFRLGLQEFLKLDKLISAVNNEDYTSAAIAILDIGDQAELAASMRTGDYVKGSNQSWGEYYEYQEKTNW